MSIFPKRTIPGRTVTIHWSIALESQQNRPLFPFIRLGVKSPDGHIMYLCQQHILLLPKNYGADPETVEIEKGIPDQIHNLPRNIPMLILADYLSGKRRKEQLVEILTRIKSARHFYFSYQIPENASLGKYELVSELYLEGNRHKSLTAEEDFFYVDKITVDHNKDGAFTINNLSPEDCPVKIIDYSKNGADARLYTISPLARLIVEARSKVAYLLYNEERESIALSTGRGKKIVRNQTLQNFEKKEGDALKVYIMFPDSDDAYILEGNYLKIWQLADGTVDEPELRSIDDEAYSSMINTNLLHEI